MQFHSKTYGGSLELYDRNTCMQIHLYIIKNDAIKYFKYKCHNTYFRTFQQSYLSSYLNKLSSVLKALSLPAMPLFLPYKIKFSFSRHLGFKSWQTFLSQLELHVCSGQASFPFSRNFLCSSTQQPVLNAPLVDFITCACEWNAPLFSNLQS